MTRFLKTVVLSNLIAWTYGCAESDFSGSGKIAKNTTVASKNSGTSADENLTETADAAAVKSVKTTTEPDLTQLITDDNYAHDLSELKAEDGAINWTAADSPAGLSLIDGKRRAIADLAICLTLPSTGKIDYGATNRCPENSVVVVINDGQRREMTCCPLPGVNILSADPLERHVARTGTCGTDEVVSGVVSPFGPALLCSKLNTKYLTLGPQVDSIYARRGDSSLPQILRTIADSYNDDDNCTCPMQTILIGGHTTTDNRCAGRCAQIIERPAP